MQVILLHLFFFTTFSCVFGSHDSKNNVLISADVKIKKLLSVEDNHAPVQEEEGNSCASVEEIMRELSAERAKNRDLNQTISDILDRMADMEKDIISNEGKISENQRKVDMVEDYVVTVSKDVVKNGENIIRNEEKISQAQSYVVMLTRDVEDLTEEVAGVQDDVVTVAEDVASLATRGTWCATKNIWTTDGIISYDRLDFSDSNINITETPLDINTGKIHVSFYAVIYFSHLQASSLCHYPECGG